MRRASSQCLSNYMAKRKLHLQTSMYQHFKLESGLQDLCPSKVSHYFDIYAKIPRRTKFANISANSVPGLNIQLKVSLFSSRVFLVFYHRHPTLPATKAALFWIGQYM